MSQVKIYANERTIIQYRELLSHAIHQALIEELKYPVEKRFQRFISLKPENFIYPSDRSQHYIIIELSMFAYRSPATKSNLFKPYFAILKSNAKLHLRTLKLPFLKHLKKIGASVVKMQMNCF